MNLNKLEFDTLDSDILAIDKSYNKSNGSCFWVAETVVNDDYFITQQKQKILGTTAVRNLNQFESTCELKRMYVLRDFRRLGLGQKLLDIAVDFAKRLVIQGWSWIVQRCYMPQEHYI
jgi:GNAT superfamily N-acetyltransferase